jgi:hypothetical protein
MWPPQVELEPRTTPKQGGQKMTLTLVVRAVEHYLPIYTVLAII